MKRRSSVALPLLAVGSWLFVVGAAAPAPNGNVVPVLDPADGKVAVVASSAPVDGRVAVVVQNGTTKPVRSLKVNVFATRPDGGLATRAVTDDLVPSTLAPGAIAIGAVDFGPRPVSPNATLTFTVKSGRAPSSASPTALGVDGFVLSPPQDGKVAQTLGVTLTNPGSRTVAGPIDVVVVCFGESSRPTVATVTTMKKMTLRPSASRQATVKFRSLCPTYLVAARGTSVR
jgi:hypothetical protein